MDKWFGADAEEHTMLSLSQPEKQHRLFRVKRKHWISFWNEVQFLRDSMTRA